MLLTPSKITFPQLLCAAARRGRSPAGFTVIRAALTAALGVALALALPAQAAPPEPDGYRNQDYRSPVPAALRGATVLTTAQAHALWETKSAVFVDVLPQAPKPKNLPNDSIWRDPPREDIPSSVWLPDTGYGELTPAMQDYFLTNLKKAARADLALAFYCRRDCWMSWNAAKRALALGFVSVDWYPEGVEGWSDAGFPLEARHAEPRP